MSTVDRRGERPTRTCERCGRTGKNAFRPLILANRSQGWVCAHEETCATRTRVRARRDYRTRRAGGRLPFIDKPVCVIGSDSDDRQVAGEVLTELAGLDVDVLDGGPRSLARLTMRDYGCVVVMSSWTDPVSFLSDLTRRLEVMHRRGVPIVVCHTDAIASPARAELVVRSGAHTLLRPYEARLLVETVARAAVEPQRPIHDEGQWAPSPAGAETPQAIDA